MANCANLLRLKHAAHPNHDRSGRFGSFTREQRAFRQHEVHAGELNTVDGANGSGKLSLQGAEVVDILDEAGGAQRVGLVEDFIANPAALRQAGFGKLHPQAGHLVFRHHDDRTVIAELEGDGLTLKLLDDARGVLVAQIVKQCGHLRRGDTHDDEGEEAYEGQRHGNHGCQTGCSKRFLKILTDLATNQPHQFGPKCRLGKICPWDGFYMVNAG